jgi:predicted phage baseplate assembly protein
MAAPPLKFVVFKIVPLTPSEFGAALREDLSPRLRLQLIDRDGRTGRLDIDASLIALEPAAADDESVSEIAFIDDEPTTAIVHDRDRTTLQLATPLGYVYDRATVRINANVAAATHGESVKELLGSGDATIPYQSFTLRQPPLTYVSADTPNGRASTLKIYVNDVRWDEAPFFYGRGATERIYILRHDDDGRTTVQFGDGSNGARLPTGQNNVRAEYRKGTGLGGVVEAGQLSQLVSRPLGLKDVVNPEDAKGAEDPESRDDARHNAPTTVLTLDRAVSLQDYEDFARTFAGIAKAQAVWVWDGRQRSIFLTVAGADGEVLEEDGSVIAKLKEALRQYGDPFVAFTVKSYRQALFQIHGTVTIHSQHVIDTVMAVVTADLSARYAFDARSFGQPVALSEVIAAIQAVSGVVAVDIDKFYRTNAPTPAIQPRLIADRPAMGADGVVVAAELLLLDTTSLNQLKAVQ